MKKLISFALAALLLLSTLVGCASNPNDTAPDTEDTQNGIQAYGPDTWDGSVASSFDGGDGSETDPYRIATAEQLAFLASEINSGKSYTGKHFALVADLDLAEVPWTPIGNGTYSFDGFFDGKGHTISNLNITNGHKYVSSEASEVPKKQYTSGLFGSCTNSVIRNIKIDHAYISITNTRDQRKINAGILVGDMRTDTALEITDVIIDNSSIVCDFEQELIPAGQGLGGIAGYIRTTTEAKCTLSNLQSTIAISIENGRARDNYIGGIVGQAVIRDLCDVKNCASYLSVQLNTEQFIKNNYLAAFGYLSAQNNKVSIENMFSKVSVNMIFDKTINPPRFTANIISGLTSCGVQGLGGFRFENVFGFVEQKDHTSGEIATSFGLHDIPYPEIYTETNCKGCDALPDNHGFDTNIWDVSNHAKPVLK